MKLSPRQQKIRDYNIKKKYVKDMIQPSNPLFKRYYPEQAKAMDKIQYDLEVNRKQEKQRKDEFFKKYRTGVHSQQMRNTLKLEEQLEHGRR